MQDRAYLISLLIGCLVFAASFVVNYYFSLYHDSNNYAPVGDLILDQIPTYNLHILFTWGFYSIIGIAFAYPFFVRQELMPFTLKTFGILMLVRSCFIVLTHVGPPVGFFYEYHPSADTMASVINPFRELIFRNDLFFSGHTAVPFLAFLLFKDSKLKWFMLFSAFLMGSTVLLMHVHYSIDVFAAFFITHGIYALSDKVFNNLNLKFAMKINMHGWKALQQKFNDIREQQKKVKLLNNKKKLGLDKINYQ